MCNDCAGFRITDGSWNPFKNVQVGGAVAMLDAGLDSTPLVESLGEVLLGARILGHSVKVELYVDLHCVVNGVEVMHGTLSAKQDVLSYDHGVEF
jgi:hypothetical protein